MTTMSCAFLSAAACAAVNASSSARSVTGKSVPSFGVLEIQASHTGVTFPEPRYSPRLLMYCTTPSGTRYQTGSPPATRARQADEEIAIAGTPTGGAGLGGRGGPGRSEAGRGEAPKGAGWGLSVG